MWLKVSYSSDKLQDYNFDAEAVGVELVLDTCAPVADTDPSVRLSPIFPLIEDAEPLDQASYELHFFEFSNSFQILGKINQYGSVQLKNRTYFSSGACSVLLFSDSAAVLEDFRALKLPEPKAYELWVVKDGHINSAKYKQAELHPTSLKTVQSYATLPPAVRTILDEFVVSIHLIASKTDSEEHERIQLFEGLVERVDGFIGELHYLHTLAGTPPDSFWTTNPEISTNPLVRDLYSQQIVDRLIQITSALSYVSTQMHAGSVPVLERRSLIRRNSLLGIGTALRTLDRVVGLIESAFRTVNFEEIILNQLARAQSLPGTDDPTYPDRTGWSAKNLEAFELGVPLRASTQKLAYFSSRNGFRESEFAITAALNSLWNGLSLEWSLMTITHEMLHSHVRLLLTFLFFRPEGSETENYRNFYERFYKKVIDKEIIEDYSLLDSIRELIFTYCLRTQTHGSITVARPLTVNYELKAPKDSSVFYELLSNEFRNVNEILVHVLDLHYFYEGRVTKYIPLIWCSWSAVPNVRADLRQYILRSLLTLASKTHASQDKRFHFAVEDFKSILADNRSIVDQFPILKEVQKILSDRDLLLNQYYNPFINSLILVDLAKEILFASTVAKALTKDKKISFQTADDKAEVEFEYSMPHGFFDDTVDSPIPYLFDRMLRVLRGEFDPDKAERDITTVFLAMNAR